jgi:hypothetical protein
MVTVDHAALSQTKGNTGVNVGINTGDLVGMILNSAHPEARLATKASVHYEVVNEPRHLFQQRMVFRQLL